MSTVSALIVVASTRGVAQVGYPPARRPYADIATSQELTLLFSYYHAKKDPAGVAPQSGNLVGAHYEWRASGPAHLTAELVRIASSRNLIDPALSGTARSLGTVDRPLYSADLALGLALTGARTWHQLVPELKTGLGFISDFHTRPDSGGFKFGTRFAISWGAGVRWLPGGSWQARVDLTNRLHTVAYPSTYYVAPTGGTAVVLSGQAKSLWTNNPALTLGISYLFGR